MDGDTTSYPDPLPHALDAFVGRRDELEELSSLLPATRLLTLTGTGGVGKTRLALQVAASNHARFSDGVRMADLSRLTDPALLLHFVASQCSVAVRSGTGIGDALLARLRRQHLLLVLDNCEHLLPSLSWLVANLLSGCPNLHVFATSREPLSVPGEVTWTVGPLRLPVGGDASTPDDILASDAASLFLARIRQALPDFVVDADNANDIARICAQVDGLPLALELAAGWLRIISLSDLARRIADPIALLDRGVRSGPDRQQSLRASIEWSYTLLTASEQAVFARLAVFPGSFPLDAAIRIGGADGQAEEDVLSILARLVETSMVLVVDRIPEVRYRLLTPIRHFARSRLEAAGTLDAVRERHLAWCRDLVDQRAPEGSSERRLALLESEYDSLRAAMEWALASGAPVRAGTLAAGVWTFWLLRGLVHEGRHWLGAILARLAEPAPLRAHLLWVAGILARPDAAAAMQVWTESLGIWQRLDNGEGEARVLASMGYLDQVTGDHERSFARLQAALTALGETPDYATEGRVRASLSTCLLAMDDVAGARREALAAQVTCRAGGDAFGEAAAIANLGLVERRDGNDSTARQLWEECLASRRRMGDLGGSAHVLTLLGNLAVDVGNLSQGKNLLREGLSIRRRIGTEDGFAEVLMGLARVELHQGALAPAVTLAAMASSLSKMTGEPARTWDRARNDDTIRTLRAAVDPDTFARAWDAGVAFARDPAFPAGDWPEVAEVDHVSFGSGNPVPSPAAMVEPLTRREADVLRLLVLGLTYAQIGEALTISHRTVDAHARAVYAKLDVHSRSAATRVALQHHLV